MHWPGKVSPFTTSFLPIPGGKYAPGVRRNHFSIFLQAMKNPPLDDAMFVWGTAINKALAERNDKESGNE